MNFLTNEAKRLTYVQSNLAILIIAEIFDQIIFDKIMDTFASEKAWPLISL